MATRMPTVFEIAYCLANTVIAPEGSWTYTDDDLPDTVTVYDDRICLGDGLGLALCLREVDPENNDQYDTASIHWCALTPDEYDEIRSDDPRWQLWSNGSIPVRKMPLVRR